MNVHHAVHFLGIFLVTLVPKDSASPTISRAPKTRCCWFGSENKLPLEDYQVGYDNDRSQSLAWRPYGTISPKSLEEPFCICETEPESPEYNAPCSCKKKGICTNPPCTDGVLSTSMEETPMLSKLSLKTRQRSLRQESPRSSRPSWEERPPEKRRPSRETEALPDKIGEWKYRYWPSMSTEESIEEPFTPKEGSPRPSTPSWGKIPSMSMEEKSISMDELPIPSRPSWEKRPPAVVEKWEYPNWPSSPGKGKRPSMSTKEPSSSTDKRPRPSKPGKVIRPPISSEESIEEPFTPKEGSPRPSRPSWEKRPPSSVGSNVASNPTKEWREVGGACVDPKSVTEFDFEKVAQPLEIGCREPYSKCDLEINTCVLKLNSSFCEVSGQVALACKTQLGYRTWLDFIGRIGVHKDLRRRMERYLRPELLETDPAAVTAHKEWLLWKKNYDNFLKHVEKVQAGKKMDVTLPKKIGDSCIMPKCKEFSKGSIYVKYPRCVETFELCLEYPTLFKKRKNKHKKPSVKKLLQ